MRKLVLLICVTAALAAAADSLSKRRAPGFSLPDAFVNQHDLADYRGKWVLLDYMQTSCAGCRALTKLLETKKAQYKGKFEVLSVVISPPDTQPTVKAYMTANNMTSPILFDQGQMAFSYFKAMNFSTPHLFAIDPSGNIVHDWDASEVENPKFPAALDLMFNVRK